MPDDKAQATGQEQGGQQAGADAGKEDPTLLREVMQKKEQIRELKKSNQALMSSLDKFKDFDPDEYKRLLDEKAKAEDDRMKRAGEFDKLKETILQKHQEERSTWDVERKSTRAKISKLMIENQIQSAAAKAINPAQVVRLMRDYFGLAEGKGGELQVAITDVWEEDGFSKLDGQANQITLPQAVEAYLGKNPHLVQASGKQGTGSAAAATSPAAASPEKPQSLEEITHAAFMARKQAQFKAGVIGALPSGA